VCFVFHKTISELEHVILTTLFLTMLAASNFVPWQPDKYETGASFPHSQPMLLLGSESLPYDLERARHPPATLSSTASHQQLPTDDPFPCICSVMHYLILWS
jgi:hypothetical protein